jgi:DNA-binding transcriptional regulator YbjK
MSQTGRAKTKAQDAGWRGSVDGWLDAAYDALKESGVEAVRVMPLAKRLNLSRTSFYWFYEDREQLLAALLARWRDKNTGGMVSQCESYAESISEAKQRRTPSLENRKGSPIASMRIVSATAAKRRAMATGFAAAG